MNPLDYEMMVSIGDVDGLWTFDPPVLTGMVTPMEVFLVKCL
jgi:hypothetical protein